MSEYEADWEKCCREFKEKLIKENKALEDKVSWGLVDYKRFRTKYDAMRQSKDELLESCQVMVERLDPMRYPMMFVDELRNQIQRAEALKEKEIK